MTKLILFFHRWFYRLLDYLLSWLGEFTISSMYYFKYCLLVRVFDVEGAHVSAAKADSSSLELVRDTSSLVSFVEMFTTLLEDVVALPLDFLFMTVIHCWLSTCQDGPTLSLLEE